MRPRAVLEGNNESGARAVDAHGSSNLVTAGDARQLIAGPDTEDGSDGEVGVHNAGTIKGVERHTESACEMRQKTRADQNSESQNFLVSCFYISYTTAKMSYIAIVHVTAGEWMVRIAVVGQHL